MTKRPVVLANKISNRIVLLRGQKVMIDTDIAALYGVTTKRLTNRCDATVAGSRAISCFR